MATPEKVKVRKAASRRDVYWCFGISIVMSILALGIGVGRSQQLADERVHDNERSAQQRIDDQAAIRTAQIAQLRVANFESCKRANAHDQKLLDYIDAQVERGLEALRATVAAPTSTEDQKRTALRNYGGAVYQQMQLHDALTPDKCESPKG